MRPDARAREMTGVRTTSPSDLVPRDDTKLQTQHFERDKKDPGANHEWQGLEHSMSQRRQRRRRRSRPAQTACLRSDSLTLRTGVEDGQSHALRATET